MPWRNFLWTPHPKHSFFPLGHRLERSLAQQGSHVSRSWTLFLPSTTLWWGDTTTHEGESRLSVPQESLHKMMRHCLSLMSPLFSAPSDIFWHYPVFPSPPHLRSSSLFSPQSHPKHRRYCRSQLPLSLPYFFPAGTSCMFVHTIPSSFLLLLHSLTQHSPAWFGLQQYADVVWTPVTNWS